MSQGSRTMMGIFPIVLNVLSMMSVSVLNRGTDMSLPSGMSSHRIEFRPIGVVLEVRSSREWVCTLRKDL